MLSGGATPPLCGTASLLALAVSLAVPSTARGDTITLTAGRDTTLYSENGAISNGAGDYLFTGRTQDGFFRRALLWFDVASAVPPGATVTGATVTLTLSRTRTESLPVELHRVTAPWGEGTSHAPGEEGAGAAATAGDATWTHRLYPSTLWATAGGEHAAAASATAAIGKSPGPYSWTSAQLAAEVQGWLDGTLPNHGWLLLATTSGTKETKRFNTHENPDAGTRPALTLTFTSSTPTGACCAADGTCSVVASPGSACAGEYRDGTSCTPNPCPAPAGACCLPVAAATCRSLGEAACRGEGGTFRGSGTACATDLCPVVLEPFVDPLPRPRVATPTAGLPGGAATYALSTVELTQRLHRDLPPTRVWGFDDGAGATYPGPTIEAFRGEPLEVVWRNELRDASGALRTEHLLPVDTCLHGAMEASPRTVVHLHGGHVSAESDGYPEATLLPGQSVAYDYPNAQQAATLWYHDHALGITRLNVYLGLAGFYLLRDAVEAGLGLPSGDHEIPLAIQDRTFRADGSLAYPASWHEHVFGDVILVNGAVWPYLAVDRGKYRFRILNGSGSRSYRLKLSTGRPIAVVGTDAGLLAAPVSVTSLLLTPGERADVVVDFGEYGAGTEVLLENDAPAPFPGPAGEGVIPQVMKFVVTAATGHTAPLPVALRPRVPLDPAAAIVTRDFVLDKSSGDPCTGSVWRINGLGWEDVTERPALGTTEIWRFVNASGTVHPMHMHLVAFQVLDRQVIAASGGSWVPVESPVAPSPEEAGWKDTVAVAPSEAVRVIARFEDFVGLFPYHCHILEHEDHEMMRQFETTTVCGDGARGLPVEACDDGNTLPGDGCSPTCASETCGDGVVQEGFEECDDGNASSADACLTTCIAARCGDRFVREGVEGCDDGNGFPGDGCSPACAAEPPDDSPRATGGCGCGAGGDLGAAALAALVALVRRRRRARSP
jgi:spore coat protein A